MLDVMSTRSPEASTDNSSKTMLGTEQKQWLKDTLLAATEPVIIAQCLRAVDRPDGTSGNGWGLYGTERAELGTFFTANGLNTRLYLIASDMHALAWDERDQHPLRHGLRQRPAAGALGPMNHSTSVKGGPYTVGPIATTAQQYGKFVITDNGGATIAIQAVGYSTTTAAARTVQFDETVNFSAPSSLVLNQALALRLGTVVATKAYVGTAQVWP